MNNKEEKLLCFKDFLHEVEQGQFATNMTSTGTLTIQQTVRNEWRRKGVKALLADLMALYGDDFDIVETKDGIVLVVENADFTFSWELKSTIKALDFDPFLEAGRWEDEENEKRAKKASRDAEKLAKEKELEEKRRIKLAEIERKRAEQVEE